MSCLLWTLPDPPAALAAWRSVAPTGRLVLFEGLWGSADPLEALRQRAREGLRRLRREPDHHGSYAPELRQALPLAAGTHPDRLVELVEAASWGAVRLERLRDVEWAILLRQPPAARLLGTTPASRSSPAEARRAAARHTGPVAPVSGMTGRDGGCDR
jgi:hypothetical protein